jgi:hypothetical protein
MLLTLWQPRFQAARGATLVHSMSLIVAPGSGAAGPPVASAITVVAPHLVSSIFVASGDVSKLSATAPSLQKESTDG